MKKLFVLYIIACTSLGANAQDATMKKLSADSLSASWCLDVNLKAGMQSQNLSTVNFAPNYLNALNDTISKLKFSNGSSYGFDLHLAYFFDKKRHFGIGSGFTVLWQQGDVTMDKFHIEYRSTDAQSPGNETFRQVITAVMPVKETISSTNINIPILLKYKTQFSSRFGFGVDAGILLNLNRENTYSSNAIFDYEAIYKFSKSGNNWVAVYDNAATPDKINEQFITRKQISQENTGTDLQTYFNNLRSQGYNVGLNQKPVKNSGSISYNGALGFIVQPSISYKLSNSFSLNMGLYFTLQSFDNSDNNKNYKLTDKVGDYNSLLNCASKILVSSYGLNLGLRIYFDK